MRWNYDAKPGTAPEVAEYIIEMEINYMNLDARFQIIRWTEYLLILRVLADHDNFDSLGELYSNEAIDGLDSVITHPESPVGQSLKDANELEILKKIGNLFDLLHKELGTGAHYRRWVTHGQWHQVESLAAQLLSVMQLSGE